MARAMRLPRALRRRVVGLRFEVRSLLGRYASLYLPAARWRRRRRVRVALDHGGQPDAKAPVDRDTDIVIEGFPRSANTFAATAFELVQPNNVRVARHLHVPSQIVFAAKYRIPAMVLIREPEDAVLSLIVRAPALTLKQGLRDYLRFYQRILPHRDRFVVAPFEEVCTDFGRSIRRLNERFGTSFREFNHTTESVARCYRIMEEHERSRSGSVVERRVARPSTERDRMKDALRHQFGAADLARMRDEASRLYKQITSP